MKGISGHTPVLAVLRDTIMFTLAGAVLIQIIASWMIVSRAKKNRIKPTDDVLRQR